MIMLEEEIQPRAKAMTVELVDNWHRNWNKVFSLIDHLGQAGSLMIDPHGWLSARQNLLAAFIDGEPAGHICFRVQPACENGKLVTENGRAVMEAQLEAFGVVPGLASDDIAMLLKEAAQHRAQDLKCRRFHGIDRTN
ncbi:MAG TPA: hypothetical protein VIL86_15310 [Tepidisphaeraceae bacterium]|jgi:hypothetical protein